VCLGCTFDPQGGGLPNATEGTIGGVGLPPHFLLGALVSPGDSWVVVFGHHHLKAPWDTCVVSRGIGWVKPCSMLGHTQGVWGGVSASVRVPVSHGLSSKYQVG
jgi:hypothetical protein